jgi:hypothetical protein
MQEISLLEAPLGITTIEGIDTSIVSKYCYKSGQGRAQDFEYWYSNLVKGVKIFLTA